MAKRKPKLSHEDRIKKELYKARKKKDIFCIVNIPIALVKGSAEQKIDELKHFITIGNDFGYQVWLFELDKPDNIIIRYMDMRINLDNEMKEYLYAQIDN